MKSRSKENKSMWEINWKYDDFLDKTVVLNSRLSKCCRCWNKKKKSRESGKKSFEGFKT